ncbi:PLP-dependent aminotransferase family protein [Desulfuromonas sp. TF]|uniref:MocR-like pyridoxine biosynthesis transcription factor PdxR n=1 Tax=Desulfuromonas sp. TF TaxID=1232410 RepID=UPI0003FCB103|nr:PLP-dependent aminotransferase family protein [Desulfuromonas sp. TF]
MFILNTNDSTPLYRQLYQQIRDQVLAGELPAHSRLPSIRDMAVELAASRNTVEGAYQELCAEGYLYGKSRSGYFVSDIDPELVSSTQLVPPQQDLRPGPAESYRYDFHPARLDPQSFPSSAWRKCLIECLRSDSGTFSRYSEPQGEWGLRRTLQYYLERSRGVRCSPDQIVICSGLQQGLDVVAQLIRERHVSVATENPGYHLPRDLFRNHGFKVVPIGIGPDGLDLDALTSSACTVAYITPSHQMPLGQVMPVANRLELISWAKKMEGLIIEDDYDSELRYVGRPISSLQGLYPQGDIIYQGTFSKVFSPALRLSYMVLPRTLLHDYHRLFRNYLCPVPLLIQRAMILFMERGHWEQHLRRCRIYYRKKHGAMLKAIEQSFGSSARVIGQGAGLHVVLELTDGLIDEAGLVERAKQKGCRLLPVSDFYASGSPETNKLLLGFGGVDMDDIPHGVQILSTLIK